MRQFLDHRRRRSSAEVRAEVRAEDVDAFSATGPAPDPTTRLTLLQALATLPVRDRAIVVLRYWEDQSVAATAEALDITPELVRTAACGRWPGCANTWAPTWRRSSPDRAVSSATTRTAFSPHRTDAPVTD
jgi:Sigma-70, region 4